MELVVDSDGSVWCLYDETIDLRALGVPLVARASYVEPDEQGYWQVDLHPVDGPVLGPFAQRSEALACEAKWLAEHWLLEPHSRDEAPSG